MALTSITVTLGAPANGIVGVTVNESGTTKYVPLQYLKDLYQSRDVDERLHMLFGQMMKALADAGVNPATATNLQIKNAIEAATYYV